MSSNANRESAQKARMLYDGFKRREMYLTNVKTADMVKAAENTVRDVNVALTSKFSRR